MRPRVVAGQVFEFGLCGAIAYVSQSSRAAAQKVVARMERQGGTTVHVADHRGWYVVVVECSHEHQVRAALSALSDAAKALVK